MQRHGIATLVFEGNRGVKKFLLPTRFYVEVWKIKCLELISRVDEKIVDLISSCLTLPIQLRVLHGNIQRQSQVARNNKSCARRQGSDRADLGGLLS